MQVVDILHATLASSQLQMAQARRHAQPWHLDRVTKFKCGWLGNTLTEGLVHGMPTFVSEPRSFHLGLKIGPQELLEESRAACKQLPRCKPRSGNVTRFQHTGDP